MFTHHIILYIGDPDEDKDSNTRDLLPSRGHPVRCHTLRPVHSVDTATDVAAHHRDL